MPKLLNAAEQTVQNVARRLVAVCNDVKHDDARAWPQYIGDARQIIQMVETAQSSGSSGVTEVDVERVARALCKVAGDEPNDTVRDGILLWQRYTDEARAALEAAQLPTPIAIRKAALTMEFVEALAIGASDPPEGGFDEEPPSWAVSEDWHMYGATCGYCGCWLSIVRPGKEQCDWCGDGRDIAVRAKAVLRALSQPEGGER